MRTGTRCRSSYAVDATRRGKATSWLAPALAGSLLLTLPLEAGQIRSLNLEELTGRADRIFAGRCLETEVVSHPQLGAVTRVTFEVERAIKGDLGSTLTVEVVGASARPNVSTFTALDVPRFAPGERVVLFLYPDSSLGLTSPVALGQGKFSVLHDKEGQELAVNALGNRDLLRGLSTEAKEGVGASLEPWEEKRGIPPQTLLDEVEGLVELEARIPLAEDGRQDPTGGQR